ncbi:methionine aminotransferase [Pusillimonas sp.]|uniref:methionine aminotransferase n=1 Tax=Pusillimonas sp. TaxID=3040095 RepID=UPI0037C710F4
MNIKSRLPNVGTNIFTIMSQMALDHNAVNLGQGFPDFSPDPVLLELVNKAMHQGHNQYAAMAGVPQLRKQISEKIESLYGHKYDIDTEVTVTAGATEALMASLLALVHPGDEVIVIEPFYDLYIPVIQLAGGIPVVVPMNPPSHSTSQPCYTVDWQRVEDAITSRTRLLVINFPHNPTGIVLLEQDLDALEHLVEKHGILLLSDEVYEHIIFDGHTHLSLSTRPKLVQNTIVVSSFGKTYHITGWKMGYCTAIPAITNEIRKVHQFTVFTTSSPFQHALAQYMTNPLPYMQLAAFYQKRRDYLIERLKTTRFKPLSCDGTFFLLADYSEVSDEDEAQFARWLTTEHGVTTIPVSAFYQDPSDKNSNHQLIRLCFAKEDKTLDLAIDRLALI